MADTSAREQFAIPANRLGQLLIEARLKNGTDLQYLALKSGFTVGELRDLEAGHRLLDKDLVKTVTDIYEVDCGPILPHRTRLIIDLEGHELTTHAVQRGGRHAVPLESNDRDHVLDRYLALVYLLRNNQPGTKLTLRDEDLDILAASLAERRELIEEQLLRSMEPANKNVGSLFGLLRRHLWVPAAGALVGATSIGSLILVTAPSSGESISMEEVRTEAANIRADNSLLVVPNTVRTPNTAVVDADTANPPVNPSTEISATTVTSPDSDTSLPTGTVTEAEPEATSDTVQRPDAGPSTPQAQDLGAEAEALLPFVWQEILPNWEITYEGTNTTYRGLTYPYEASIEIFIRDTDTPETIAPILAHEIGHALDVTFLSGSDRQKWLETRGIEDAPWWADAFASDFQSGAGDFAEAFAAWATGDVSSSQIAGQPTAEEIAVLVDLLDDVLPPA